MHSPWIFSLPFKKISWAAGRARRWLSPGQHRSLMRSSQTFLECTGEGGGPWGPGSGPVLCGHESHRWESTRRRRRPAREEEEEEEGLGGRSTTPREPDPGLCLASLGKGSRRSSGALLARSSVCPFPVWCWLAGGACCVVPAVGSPCQQPYPPGQRPCEQLSLGRGLSLSSFHLLVHLCRCTCRSVLWAGPGARWGGLLLWSPQLCLSKRLTPCTHGPGCKPAFLPLPAPGLPMFSA